MVCVCAIMCAERPTSPWLLSASLSIQPRSVEVMWLADFDGAISKFNIYAKPVMQGNWFSVQVSEVKIMVVLQSVFTLSN